MRCCWMPFVLAWVSMSTPALCQSGDWGSGFGAYSPLTATDGTSRPPGDEPLAAGGARDRIPPAGPSPQFEPRPDGCSAHFSTGAASARRLKAQQEELAFLHAAQRGNRAVVESLVQFVAAELEDQRYEDVIRENVAGVAEDHEGCRQAVEKAEEDLEKQLEGEAPGAGMQKIREESLSFDEMLRVAAGIADRLETSSQALHASFARQLRDIAKIHR